MKTDVRTVNHAIYNHRHLITETLNHAIFNHQTVNLRTVKPQHTNRMLWLNTRQIVTQTTADHCTFCNSSYSYANVCHFIKNVTLEILLVSLLALIIICVILIV